MGWKYSLIIGIDWNPSPSMILLGGFQERSLDHESGAHIAEVCALMRND